MENTNVLHQSHKLKVGTRKNIPRSFGFSNLTVLVGFTCVGSERHEYGLGSGLGFGSVQNSNPLQT